MNTECLAVASSQKNGQPIEVAVSLAVFLGDLPLIRWPLSDRGDRCSRQRLRRSITRRRVGAIGRDRFLVSITHNSSTFELVGILEINRRPQVDGDPLSLIWHVQAEFCAGFLLLLE